MTRVTMCALIVLVPAVITSVVALDWERALLHVHTVTVVLLVDSDVRTRARLRALENHEDPKTRKIDDQER